MTDFVFEDFARTTLGGARNVLDGKPLPPTQMDQVIAYLKSPDSGPDGTSSYADYVTRKLQVHPPKLPPVVDCIGYSGKDSSSVSNFDNARDYAHDVNKKAALIDEWSALGERRLQEQTHNQWQDVLPCQAALTRELESHLSIRIQNKRASARLFWKDRRIHR